MSLTTPALSFGVSLSNRAVVIGNVRAMEIVEIAEEAEASGLFDSVWGGDSLIAKPRLEAVSVLNAIAARTERVKLGVACLATFPIRHPVLFAHQWVSLDCISGGRSLLAVCLGGHGPQELVNAEVTTMGTTLRERVPRMLEGMEILRKLWSEEDVSYQGRFYQFEHVTIGPPPIQQPCPIWIANNPTDSTVMERAYRRVARHADGWMTGSLAPEIFGERWRWLQSMRREEHGSDAGFPSSIDLRANVNRDHEAAYTEAKTFLDAYYSTDHSRRHLEEECVIGTPEECIEKLTAYAEAGCNVIIRLCSWNPREQLDRWITQVLPEVHRRVGIAVGA
jgi:alkanesulfonate monooxygenase SsuD/methylene tetrahydromethanopterin reductase-like flavin-dependent oxidoreductase (luciferase family)